MRITILLSLVVFHPLVAAELDWKSANGYRIRTLAQPPAHAPGFTLLDSSQSGVKFTNVLSESRMMQNQNLLNGSGVALGDYDGDGWCDIYFCDLNGTNALYRNLGDMRFAEVTDQAGVACPGQTSTGAVFADVNGDRLLDLLVTSMGGPNACFLNAGQGRFTNVTASAGLMSKLGGTSLALADIDGNGSLDLYVANYGVTSIMRSGGALSISYVNGQPVVRGRYANRVKIVNGIMYEVGEPHLLYLNDGRGVFTAVSWTDGRFVDEKGRSLKEAPLDQGLSVAFHDINADGAPDIYVCNDGYTSDRCWINDGTGRFRALDLLAWRTSSYFSMGVDFGDFDRDGRDDFFVVDMLSRRHDYLVTQKGTMAPQPKVLGLPEDRWQVRRNTLFHNSGDGTFAEMANYSGVTASEWSWSGVFLDVDLDGWLDILVSNGFALNTDDLDIKEKIARMGTLSVEQSRRANMTFPPLLTPNVAFRNQQNSRFQEIGKEWGFDSTQISHGLALADLDNDGDLDVVVNCFNSHSLIYRNEASQPRIGIRLRGNAPNTQGIGARIEVHGGPVPQSAEMISGGRYCSGDDSMRVFACADDTRPLSIQVTWRDGTVSRIVGAKPNCIYELDQSGSRSAASSKPDAVTPLFADSSALIGHSHRDPVWDDFKLQPSLPERQSLGGPGVAWADFDGDGFEDLVVGGGGSQGLAAFRNLAGKKFELSQNVRTGTGGSSGILLLSLGSTERQLLAGQLGDRPGAPGGVMGLRIADGTRVHFATSTSVGSLAAAWINGVCHLFVGGRLNPGRFPVPASSYLYKFTTNTWDLDSGNSKVLADLGLCSGAVWSDLDGDGTAELVVVCDWGSPRIFAWSNGRLIDRSSVWGVDQWVGRWQSVTAGDFNGDGRMDIAAGNWGENSYYSQAADRSARIYFGDFNGDGSVHLIETYRDALSGKFVPWRDKRFFAQFLPWLQDRFPTHQAYAVSGIEEILGDRTSRAATRHATEFRSLLLANRGGRFEMLVLPAEAQLAPVFGLAVADFNGDAKEDLFVAQNFSGVREDDSLLNSGRGLCLLGDGRGGFKVLSAAEAGFKLDGDQRGAAVADYDHDGRMDLVVTEHGSNTRLFRNAAARQGVRIDASAVPGAVLRLKADNQLGPAREIHLGSGYWSQDAATTVMSGSGESVQLWIRLPGGRTVEHAVDQGVREISLNAEGGIQAMK